MRRLLLLAPLLVACQTAAVPAPPNAIAREGGWTAQPADPVTVIERPSPTPLPKVPSIELGARTTPPAPGELPRDGAVADAFSAAGQSVRYAFEAAAGELSLFTLGAWGYERGWQSAVRLEVRNAQDQVLASRVRPGQVVHTTFFPFVAPSDGSYTLVVQAEDQFFRYVLERSSGYVTRNPGVVYAVGEREQVHGWLADGADTVRYAVDLEAGVPVALRVSNLARQARNRDRTERKRQLGRTADHKPLHPARARGERMGGEAEMRGGMRGDPVDAHESHPRLALTLRGEELGHYQLFTPAASGRHVFEVRATSAGEGGQFVVDVERGPRLVRVTGHVGDQDDDPVAGVQLDFLRAPDMDPVGHALTGADGTYALDVPPGQYEVLLRKDGAGGQSLSVPVEEASEVNAVFAPRARDAGR